MLPSGSDHARRERRKNEVTLNDERPTDDHILGSGKTSIIRSKTDGSKAAPIHPPNLHDFSIMSFPFLSFIVRGADYH